MPTVDAVVECPLYDSFRVQQIAGMFDVPLKDRLGERFRVTVPGPEEDWQIGVIVGPSGSGKTTVARQVFGAELYRAGDWPVDRAVVDGFGDLPVREVVSVLSAVGLSSPPAWVKPYHVLSNGEKFRCDLARAMVLNERRRDEAAWPLIPLTVFDEFTSVVDRTVARISSAAIAKAIRSGRIARRFVAVTCHYDVVPWLEADWTLDMASGELARGRVRRPAIQLEIRRVPTAMWGVFKRHHYLSAELHRSATCFVGLVEGSPATFAAALFFPHPTRPGWREHRTVCLPDFQGVGLGNAVSEFVAGVFRATGKPYYSTTSHPSMLRHRCRSPLWRMTRKPRTSTVAHTCGGMARTGSVGRLTAGFEYVGAARLDDAVRLGVIAHQGGDMNGTEN